VLNWSTLAAGLALFLIFFVFMALVQFSTPDMPDNDGFYHIKLAYLMRTEGLKPDFPWLPMSILNPREFYDHHFLYHVFLIPFTFGDLRLGAKWSSVVFASLTFLSVWWLLHKQNVRHSWLWALGILAVSEAFIYRMSITRAQSLSLAVLALGLHLLLTRQHKWLLPLAFLYVWLYNAFPLLMALSLVYVLVVLVLDRQFYWQPLVYTGLGIGMGMLFNPYFPYNIVFTIQHLLPKLTETTAVSVGSEWYPYDTSQILENSAMALLALFSGIVALGMTPRRMSLKTAVSLLLVTLFGLMLFQSRRFIEYFPPFVLIFTAFAWSDFLEHLEISGEKAKNNGGFANYELKAGFKWVYRTQKFQFSKILPVMILVLVLIPGLVHNLRASQRSIQGSKPYGLYAGAAAWLETNTPAGSRVFQTDWDDFPRLFFYNHHNTYLIGLDPTYMQLYNPGLYDDWVAITRGEVEKPSRFISGQFASSYVVSDLLHGGFLDQADRDEGLVEVYRDDSSVVYKVVE
jgi:hypothetical protein